MSDPLYDFESPLNEQDNVVLGPEWTVETYSENDAANVVVNAFLGDYFGTNTSDHALALLAVEENVGFARASLTASWDGSAHFELDFAHDGEAQDAFTITKITEGLRTTLLNGNGYAAYEHQAFVMPPGTHTLEFAYTRGAGTPGFPGAVIDNLLLPGAVVQGAVQPVGIGRGKVVRHHQGNYVSLVENNLTEPADGDSWLLIGQVGPSVRVGPTNPFGLGESGLWAQPGDDGAVTWTYVEAAS